MHTSATSHDQRQTAFEVKVAAEFWLELGGAHYRLIGKSVRLGRSVDNDIVIDHKSVSRYHALITLTSDAIILEDLQSRNGIQVAGNRVKRAELKDQDSVMIGDISGRFYQKLAEDFAPSLKVFDRLPLPKDFIESYKNKWVGLNKKQRFMLVGGLAFVFLAAILFLSGPSSSNVSTASTTSGAEAIATAVDRYAFEECLQFEDLGDFRRANTCFKKLSRTDEVITALNRVQKRQGDLADKRYIEGNQAFENFYYDVAILKWQEVLLIAEDGSDVRRKAVNAIQEAERRRRLR